MSAAVSSRPRWWTGSPGPSSVWWGFAVVHLYFLGWMASFFLNGDTFSDTEQYRQWAMDGYNPANLDGKISPWVYPVLAQIPIFLAEHRRARPLPAHAGS